MDKPKNPAAVALAHARTAALSPARRKKIASLAAAARWADSTVESRKKSLKPANRALAKSRKRQLINTSKPSKSDES